MLLLPYVRQQFGIVGFSGQQSIQHIFQILPYIQAERAERVEQGIAPVGAPLAAQSATNRKLASISPYA
jgi:hypothetical protein